MNDGKKNKGLQKEKKLENTFVVKSLILYLLYTGIFPSKTFSMRSIELLPVICVLIFVYPYCLVSFSFGMTVIKMLFFLKVNALCE